MGRSARLRQMADRKATSAAAAMLEEVAAQQLGFAAAVPEPASHALLGAGV